VGWRRTAATIAAAALLCAPACRRQPPAVENETLDARLAWAREVQLKQGPKAALSLYDGIIATARSNNDRKHEALALGHLGTAYKNLGDYPHAMDLQRQALAIKRQLGDEIEIAKTLSNMGLIEDAQGRCAQALELYGDSLDVFTRLKAAGFSASVLNNEGLCYDTLGDYRQSTAVYERALALHRQAENEAGESESLGNLGGVALLLGRYPEAAKDYEQSLAISTRLGIKQSMALDLINLGLARMGTSEFHEARQYLERARATAHDAGLLREEADAARGLGDWLAHAGRFDDARKALDEASRTYAQAGLSREHVDATYSLGLLDLDLGDLGRAAATLERASAGAARLQYHNGQLAAQLALTELELRRHNVDSATSRANHARQSAAAVGNQASVASALTWLSRIQQTQGHYGPARQAARAALEAALSTGSPTLVADARIVLGDALIGEHKPADARQQYEAVISNGASSSIPDLGWRAAFGCGRAFEAEGSLDRALANYLRAVAVIEEVRTQIASERDRTGFLDDKRDVYGALVRLLLRMGRTKEAFRAAERLRADGYRELLQRSLALGTSGDEAVPAALLARIRQLQSAMATELKQPPAEQRGQAIATYREELRSAEAAWSGTVDSLARRPVWAGVFERRPESTTTDIQHALAPGSALVEYVVGADQTAAFVLTNATVRARLLPVGGSELRTRIELLRGLLARREPDEWQPVAERLDAELIDPLRQAGWLGGVSRLYIVPHAELNYLPFVVLRHQSPHGPRLLVDDVAPVILPAAAALVERGPRPRMGAVRGSLLALAPASTGLRFARSEVESVARLFSASGEVFVGKEATEARFKQAAGRFRVLHLATHGFFNRVDPLFSGVELEADAADDGRLQVFEILGLRLRADLVTLSACDTALGGGELSDLPAGEELLGLTRAFLSAGSRSVLATLWEIEDRTTAQFVTDFYQAARTQGFPEALARVQRHRAHRAGAEGHPWSWAAFTITEGRQSSTDEGVTGP
jgi:CHAT domain-containing protein/Tfp pilus assembly protein PilF